MERFPDQKQHGIKIFFNRLIYIRDLTGEYFILTKIWNKIATPRHSRENPSFLVWDAYDFRKWRSNISSTSHFQYAENLGNPKVQDIIDENRIVSKILRLKLTIRYMKPDSVCEVKLISLSDASHGARNDIYGRTCTICGMIAEYMNVPDRIFHPLEWSSNKQLLVSHFRSYLRSSPQ